MDNTTKFLATWYGQELSDLAHHPPVLNMLCCCMMEPDLELRSMPQAMILLTCCN